MTIKLLPVFYPTSTDRHMQRDRKFDVYTEIVETVKNRIDRMLFDEEADYILAGVENKLVMIEPVNVEDRSYIRREIEYHPYSNLVL